MSVKSDIRLRVYFTFSLMVLFAIAIIGRAIWIQVVDGEELRKMAEKTHIKNQILPAERGNIYSEDGTLLSSTIPQFDLRVDFKSINKDTFYKYVDSLAYSLSKVLGDASHREYTTKLKAAYNKGNRYWLLKKNAPYYQYQEIREMPIFNKGKNKGGFIAEPKSKRENPYGILAYRTIGLWRENASNIGLEQKYNSVLSGREGSRIIRKTTGNVWIPIEGSELEPQNGKDIVTTIDIDIQDVTEHALMEVLKKYNAQFGSAIVMEVETGKIRALANLGKQGDSTYWEDFNYALMPSEPGSTFKLMSLLALLDDGYVNINDMVDVEGGLKRFGRQRVVDDKRGLKTITIKEAFERSSNVAFAKLIDQHYQNNPMKFIKHLQKLKLHEKTGIDLLGEPAPLIKTTKHPYWNKTTSLPWIAYGYESLISPLHICMVYNAVANNGKLMKPYLVSAIKEYGQTVEEIKPVVLESKIAKPKTIKQLQEVLHGTVENGTGRGVKSPYYNSGGKTGTAQVADKGITYRDGVRQGSFVGYFPIENPKYTIAVMIRSTPHGVYYGAVLGGSVFKTISDKLYANHIGGWTLPNDSLDSPGFNAIKAVGPSLKSIAQSFQWKVPELGNQVMEASKNKRNAFEIKKDNTAYTTIPNVGGLGLKDALYLLEPMGLEVIIKGTGKVKNQSIPPGSKIVKGQKIHLSLG